MPYTPTPAERSSTTHPESTAIAPWRQWRSVAGNAFQPVLTIRARVPTDEVPAFTRDALQEIRAYIERHHLRAEGPPFSIRHHASSGLVDVETGWPTRGAPGSGRIHSGALPASRLRSTDVLQHTA
jgi:hypothetical protein